MFANEILWHHWERYLGNLHGKTGFAARPSNFSSLPKTNLMTLALTFLGILAIPSNL